MQTSRPFTARRCILPVTCAARKVGRPPSAARISIRKLQKAEMAEKEVLAANQALLNAIAAGDYAGYEAMCDPSLTCFEPEALGHLVEGMDFHKYYFPASPPNPAPAVQNTMASPHVRLIGDSAAVVSYVRLTQRVKDGAHVTIRAEETRVWEKKGGKWVHVHMHRSLV